MVKRTKIKVKAKEPVYYKLVLYQPGAEFWIDHAGHFSSKAMIPLTKQEQEVLLDKKNYYDKFKCEICKKDIQGYLGYKMHIKACQKKNDTNENKQENNVIHLENIDMEAVNE